MEKMERYILKKGTTQDSIAIEISERTLYECNYEYFKKIFISLLTPKSLAIEDNEEKKSFDRENCSDEEYVEKLLALLGEKKPSKAIKTLVLEGNIMEVECYDLDNATSNTSIIVIYPDLFCDEKFSSVLSLITNLYDTNKVALVRDYIAIKKQEENKNLTSNVIDNFLDNNKQSNLTQKEGMVVLSLLCRNLKDYVDYFDEEYRKCHPIKFASCVAFPTFALAVLLGKFSVKLNTIMSSYLFLVSMGGIFFAEFKIWDKIVFDDFNTLKKELEEKYKISYDLDERKVVLNNPLTFYDAYTKCVKNTLELAYSKLTTPLDEEIKGLYSLLNEYHNCNSNYEKVCFAISLLNIRKQIMLKESFLDKKNAISNDDIKFIEQYIKFLTGKSSKMLDDDEVDDIIERIKQNEEKKLPLFSIDLMTKAVIHIYDNYLKEELENKEEQKELEPNIEYDLAIPLGKKI